MTLPPTVNLTFDVDFFTKKWQKSSQKKSGIYPRMYDSAKDLDSAHLRLLKHMFLFSKLIQVTAWKMTLPPTANLTFDIDFFTKNDLASILTCSQANVGFCSAVMTKKHDPSFKMRLPPTVRARQILLLTFFTKKWGQKKISLASSNSILHTTHCLSYS